MSNMKTLDDIKADMSDLYEQVKDGTTDMRLAAELANISGKFMKAYQLQLAESQWLESRNPHIQKAIGHAVQGS